ncbi:LD-carboxypeptidase [Neobacillus sp. PS3-34]|uniref:S66 family peptidase n=1 Tax=Neobacillus sp. PS3-34 TaxID=3070678 RepID=UPI0027E1B67E|nr:LD-carboxypeptidase [Neobacillus sp. PS3-34]WML47848.1 LD-carboxypeptidase [Neobacillus sp. PS3-34]
MIPKRLLPGDEIRVIAPSRSMAIVKGEQVEIAIGRLNELGFTVSFGKNVNEHDEFFSTSIEERIVDLHDAFRDPKVKGILTVLGGYNTNQLLKNIDFNLIKENPKVLCGYSDITALSLAIYQKTGLTTYYGPHFSTFGMKAGFDYTLQSFIEAVTNDAPYEINPSDTWSDDLWFLDQKDRKFINQDEYLVLQEGEAEGKLMGGNLCTLNLLQGTEFMPSFENTILFIEDDNETHTMTFDRDLQSLLHLPEAGSIKGIMIGRFQNDSKVTEAALRKIISSKQELRDIPIIANVNFGHTQPIATIPFGARAIISARKNETSIRIEQK